MPPASVIPRKCLLLAAFLALLIGCSGPIEAAFGLTPPASSKSAKHLSSKPRKASPSHSHHKSARPHGKHHRASSATRTAKPASPPKSSSAKTGAPSTTTNKLAPESKATESRAEKSAPLSSAAGDIPPAHSPRGKGALVLASIPRGTSRRAAQQRITQQQSKPVQTGAIEGVVSSPDGKGVGAAKITLHNLATGQIIEKTTTGDGVFRLIDLPAGSYELRIHADDYEDYAEPKIQLAATQVLDRLIHLKPTVTSQANLKHIPEVPQVTVPEAPAPEVPTPTSPTYPGVLSTVGLGLPSLPPPAPPLPPADEVFHPEPDRWNVAMPDWDRYGVGGERPYVNSRRFDPYDRNKWKGDYPIIGNQIFFDFTGESDTFVDGRRLPTPSDVSSARPGSSEFFGKGDQFFLDQVFAFTFDLFHGDTSFRPADWRIRVTPVLSLNFLDVQELGIVNIDVAKGTTRFDSHLGLQEAFGEVKLADLSPNFDFVSVRAGIQQFNADFRGFLFVDNQPGVRFFGNYDNNRWQYNLAYFNFLEKNTNSDLNSLALRHQQLIAANVFRQDFLFPGYTAQFSVDYNIDQASVHYDDNGFLVRPAPIGGVVSNGKIQAHSIHAVYLGWAGDGHIGRINVTNQFYQAFGNDSFNPIAQRPVTINSQFGAIELSVDKDWARFKVSSLYASGSSGAQKSGRATGFDSIDESPEFMGGIFSLWNREGIRLTGTGVQLTPENSILPDLRSNKFEGQSNFVNPGIFLVNSGATFDITPKLRSFINVSYLQFIRTEPLELLLFQENIHRSIGYDYNIGFRYRPPLTENIVLTAGAAGLTPGDGLHDIFGGRTLFSLFADVRFQF